MSLQLRSSERWISRPQGLLGLGATGPHVFVRVVLVLPRAHLVREGQARRVVGVRCLALLEASNSALPRLECPEGVIQLRSCADAVR